MQVGVAEQKQAVQHDRDQPADGERLVQGLDASRHAAPAQELSRQRQAEPHRERDQDDRDHPEGAACQPPEVLARVDPAGVHAAAFSGRSQGSRDQYLAVVEHEHAAGRVQHRETSLGTGEQRALGERLGFQPGAGDGGRLDDAGPCRQAGGGVDQVVGVAAGRAPDPCRKAAGGHGSPDQLEVERGGVGLERVGDAHLARDPGRSAEHDVPARVDGEGRLARQQRGRAVGGQALGRPAQVEAHARRAADRVAGHGDGAPGRVGGRSGWPACRRGAQSVAQRCRLGTGARVGVAGAFERAEQGRIDETAAALGRPERCRDRRRRQLGHPSRRASGRR